ncbi:MerR family transcriptional regulator [Rhodobacter calidifons]|uniref:MerR family transcriptional regulator n=1 Tax=Rhodobacter calidifons TaxID=2715277 RepID=A0ABX0G5K9_9RHOB|nr:MerR family transcriptional regulator [Rhodobacter calidifons]
MFPIGEAARQSGVAVETIRYYEREGIVPRPGRSASGRRLYARSEIDRLRFVRRCRDLGFPIAEVRALLALAEGQGTCSEAGRIARAQGDAIRRRVKELLRLEAALADLASACETGVTDCAMLRQLMADPEAAALPERTVRR